MTYRSTPSFAVGGVSWLAPEGRTGYIGDPTPTGWRCFHCNEHFTDSNAAWRHFGNPAEAPGQHPPTECQRSTAPNPENLVAELRRLYRGLEMSANIMRDPLRTGGWEGAERTAAAFDRYAATAQSLYALLNAALPHRAGRT